MKTRILDDNVRRFARYPHYDGRCPIRYLRNGSLAVTKYYIEIDPQNINTRKISQTLAERDADIEWEKDRNVDIKENGSFIPLPTGQKGSPTSSDAHRQGASALSKLKKPGGKPSHDQMDFLNRVRDAGGIAILAYSIDDVMGRI